MASQEIETRPEAPLRLAVLTDGRAGNEAQALGLAEAIARRRSAAIETRRAPLSGLRALPPARAWHALGRMAPGGVAAALGGAPAGPAPDLLIGAGRRAAPLVAALRRLHGVPGVQILAPQMPLGAFDLVIAPQHDGLTGANLIETLGAIGRVTPARLAAEAEAWRARLTGLPAPRLAVLIGGPGRMARWGTGDGTRLQGALEDLAARGWSLMVTASRRSDPALVAGLRAALDPARHVVFAGEGANPYPAMLGHARAVLVTADSVNMASEAACSGRPVHVFAVAGMARKARTFHEALAARGIARIFDGEIGTWHYAPLAEADRVAGLVLARLAPAR